MAAVGNFLVSSITRIDLLCRGQKIGSGTGFFIKHGDRWGLATNWHVLAGRNPVTGQPHHASGAVPDTCMFYTSSIHEGKLTWTPHIFPLGDSTRGEATWFQHPHEGQNIDVAVLPLGSRPTGTAKNLLDPTGHDAEMFIDLGAEVFLPGYPLGISFAGMMAIWKRASVASSLEFGEGIIRSFYVDTATREGMSGAPCLAVSNWRYYALDRATNQMRVVERPISWRLLGVYSGRVNASDNFEAQLGVVWRETLILEAFAAGQTATIRLA